MSRIVVVLPGATFGPFAPQLFLPAFAAMRRGAEVRAVEWEQRDVDAGPDAARIAARADAQLAGLRPQDVLVVGKSLGTRAAAVVGDRAVPAIWITPLLTEPTVVEGLRRSEAPFLLAGGTADPYWDGAAARSLTPHVLELDGADHGLFVPGPLADSATNLGRLAAAAEAFLDGIVWPSA